MPEHLEATIDKFVFRVPTDRLYCRDGLWILELGLQGESRVRVGVTDYLQQHSGDATFVTVRPLGTRLLVGDELADFETMKVNIELASPVAGTIVSVNDALEHHPELVNQSPYESGWLAEIDATGWAAMRGALLDAKAYFAVMTAEAKEEMKTR